MTTSAPARRFRQTDLSSYLRDLHGARSSLPETSRDREDRIANAIAAQEFYGIPAIVIDMGTAVTFDIISKRVMRGIIAPDSP